MSREPQTSTDICAIVWRFQCLRLKAKRSLKNLAFIILEGKEVEI